MTEIALTIVILALLGFIYYDKLQTLKERSKLINAIIAKDAKELQELDFSEKVEPSQQKSVSVEDDLVSVSDLSDKDFDKHVLGKD